MPNPIGVLLVATLALLILGQFVGVLTLLVRMARMRLRALPLQNGSLNLFVSVGLTPAVMLVLASTCFRARWQGERGQHWIAYSHEGWAGVALLPLFLLGSWSAWSTLHKKPDRGLACLHAVVLGTLTLACAWATWSTLFGRLTADEMLGGGDSLLFAVFPALATLGYGLLAVSQAFRVRGLGPPKPLLVWAGLVALSLWARFSAARALYSRLPVDYPVDYGDCFIVGAAANGHPQVVRSWPDTRSGRRVNRQLARFRCLEGAWMVRAPQSHRLARRLYNSVAPPIARSVGRNALLADAVYLALKPMEWSVAAGMWCAGRLAQ